VSFLQAEASDWSGAEELICVARFLTCYLTAGVNIA